METIDMESQIISELTSSARTLDQLANESASEIGKAADLLVARLKDGGRVYIFGNGGSAADAQHFASELVGRYILDRPPLPAIALTTDTSVITSISNDYSFSEAFARQVEALVKPGDVVIGISTSGRSANVVAGIHAARDIGAHTIALIGAGITGLAGIADIVIPVPSSETPRIQEAHSVIIHTLCNIVDQSFHTTGEQAGEAANGTHGIAP